MARKSAKSEVKQSTRGRKPRERKPDIFDMAIEAAKEAANEAQDRLLRGEEVQPFLGTNPSLSGTIAYVRGDFAYGVVLIDASSELRTLCNAQFLPLGIAVEQNQDIRVLPYASWRIRPAIKPGNPPTFGFFCEAIGDSCSWSVFLPMRYDPVTGKEITLRSVTDELLARLSEQTGEVQQVVQEVAQVEAPSLPDVEEEETDETALPEEEIEAMRNDDEPSRVSVAEDVAVEEATEEESDDSAQEVRDELEIYEGDDSEDGEEPEDEAVEEEEDAETEEESEAEDDEEVVVDFETDSTERLHEICVRFGLINPKAKVSRETLIKLLSDYAEADE
jgi:hypothetical protein